MNPTIASISETNDVYKFTLSGLNVSLVNAIRRTILSDIPTVVFDADDSEHCIVHINTGRLHNEILKHRLSCIPIHVDELDLLPGNYIMELDITNDTDNMIIVTSEDFKIKNKTSNNSTYIIEQFDNLDAGEIKLLSDIIKSRINKCIIFLIIVSKPNTTCYISVSKNIISSYNAKNLSKVINEKFSGKGGGSETFATSILTKIKMDKLKGYIKEILK